MRFFICIMYNKMVRESLKQDLFLLNKRLQNQGRVSSSEWQMNKKTLVVASSSSFGNGVALKHDSYERYLAKKKNGHLRKINGTAEENTLYNLIPGCTCGGSFVGRK